MGDDVFVAESVDGMFAAQNGGEELAIIGRERMETSDTFPIFGHGLAQAVEFGNRFAYGLNVGECIQIAGVGLLTDLSISPEVGHAVAHWLPPPLFAINATRRSLGKEWEAIGVR